MKIIYKPKGAAKEYADLALNVYTTCPHGCTYCYAPGTLRKSKKAFFAPAKAKRNVLSRVESDASRMAAKGDRREILLSFIGDMFPSKFATTVDNVTGKVLDILGIAGLNATVLTKGGMRAIPYLRAINDYVFRLGTTLTCRSMRYLHDVEPEAATYHERVYTMSMAHSMGIKTWVSLEPVFDPEEAVAIIKETHSVVDKWKIGKINHHQSGVDWAKGKNLIVDALKSVGAMYTLKKSIVDAASPSM